MLISKVFTTLLKHTAFVVCRAIVLTLLLSPVWLAGQEIDAELPGFRAVHTTSYTVASGLEDQCVEFEFQDAAGGLVIIPCIATQVQRQIRPYYFDGFESHDAGELFSEIPDSAIVGGRPKG